MTHDLRDAIPMSPAIADAVVCLRVQREALQVLVDRASYETRFQRNVEVDFQRQTVINVEKRLADAVLEALDGKEQS